MVNDQPRIFFLRYWRIGNADQLAKGLRAAIDQTGKKQQGHAMNMNMYTLLIIIKDAIQERVAFFYLQNPYST
ncbi:MAG TPA: DUF1259 domain-containing protein [Segetibacter sp.]|nr:DUF1259 domain-containing protein [Segetibacter sp.]